MDDQQQKRRTSQRYIKRKKFDDELVESSIPPKQTRTRLLSANAVSVGGTPLPTVNTLSPKMANTSSVNATPNTSSTSDASLVGSTPNVPTAGTASNSSNAIPSKNNSNKTVNTPNSSSKSTSATAMSSPANVAEATPTSKQSTSGSAANKSMKIITTTTKKRRQHRQAHNNAVKDIGRWKPEDDLLLVLGVQQTNDLDSVYRGVKFSCKFTLKEIEYRWYALLYDPTIAKIAVSAMRQLHPDTIAEIQAKALFSEEEESLIKSIPSNSQPTIETFQVLLEKNVDKFLQYRTAKSLHSHWTLLKHYHLLNDQNIQTLTRHEDVINFSDAEETIEKDLSAMASLNTLNSSSLSTPNVGGQATSQTSNLYKHDELVNSELMLADRKMKREIRQLENEIPKWQVLVDSITGVAPSDFDSQTLAVLRGRLVRYLMRSREITLGRCTKDSLIDVDLSLEGPASKISRKQGLVKLQQNGDFMLINTGKRQFYVDSKPVLGGGGTAKLCNNSVVEIAALKFVFLINQDLIAAVRAEALKKQM